MSKRKLSSNNLDNQENIPPVEAKKSKTIQNSDDSATSKLSSNNETNPTHLNPNEDEIKFQNSLNQIKVIKELIKSLGPTGNSSIGGEANDLPVSLQLHVQNLGEIKLPLRDPQAKELIKACKQAPYGKNYKTLVDKTVRDTFQLEPSQIEIKNPEWNAKMNSLVDKVARDLGCAGRVEARLYKMLLYQTGSHFKKHTDTEKENGMFGTLIIQLPSIYTGGELVVHGKTKQTYDFGQSTHRAADSIFYAAHYADLEHEILKVKSGYRLVLIYNLCWINGNGSSPNDPSLVEKMAQSLSVLNESINPLAMFLDHKYTAQGFKTNGINALKGVDNDRYSLLKNASDKLPEGKQLSFYIARANLKILDEDTTACSDNEGDDDDDEEDEEEKNFKKLDLDKQLLLYYDKEDDYGADDEATDSYSEDSEKETSDERSENKSDRWYEHERTTMVEKFYDFSKSLKNISAIESEFELGCFAEVIDPSKDVGEKLDPKNAKTWGDDDKTVEKSGYTGNEGATRTTIYHKYMLVFWPKLNELETLILIHFKLGLDKLTKSFKPSAGKDSKEGRKFSSEFSLLIKRMKENKEKGRLPTVWFDEQRRIIEFLVYLKDIELAKVFVGKIMSKSSRNLVKLIKLFGWDQLGESMKQLMLPVTFKNIDENCALVKVII